MQPITCPHCNRKFELSEVTATPHILPDEWIIGMKVRYRADEDWAWSKGDYGVINDFHPRDIGRKGHEYQVFYTTWLDRQGKKTSGSFWTTPNDVDWVQEEDLPWHNPQSLQKAKV